MNCRFCNKDLKFQFIDLVNSPLSNSYLTKDELDDPEIFYPIKLYVCDNCFLVQIDEYKKSSEIFNDKYAYFSSYSSTWLEHAKNYVDMVTQRFDLDKDSFIVEIASNDGYLLQFFVEKKIPCLGIEPASNTAAVARLKNIDVIEDYFGIKLARKLTKKCKKPDLLLGNNVLAHVPDIYDFVKGLKLFLANTGVITMEFPHVMNLIEQNQFDTIYHEHFSYFSFLTVKSVFEKIGLEIFDVEEIPTHGGSLRIYAKHKEDKSKQIFENVNLLLDKELKKEMNNISFYKNFQAKVNKVKYDLTQFLIDRKKEGKKIAAYGAAAKGNTLLNYCGIKKDLIEFVVDRSPIKQGKFLPASHIPIVNENKITEIKPDYVLILPWNIKNEIINQLE
ncbi:hypothetical protein LCGC14_2828760, partial [marine sediment metagenome]